MAMISWDISLSTGVSLVDEQHKKLVDLVNRLYDAMLKNKGNQVLGQILTELIDYTVYHFKTEEDLFHQYGYREAPVHMQEHKDLTEKAVALKVSFESGKAAITLEVMNFLKDWLVNHIMKSDKAFGPFLNSKGVR